MIELPPSLKDVKTVQDRCKRAFAKEGMWRDLLESVYEYFLPQRNIFDEQAKGSKKMDKIYDATALEAIQEGASRLQDGIAPIWKRWAKVEPSDAIKRQLEEMGEEAPVTLEQIQEHLDLQSEIAFDYLNRSNFATQFYEFALDILIGTGTIRIDEEDDNEEPFTFHTMPPKGIAYEEGPKGTIETHWRKFKVTARNVTRIWKGFKPSESVAQIIEKTPDCEIEIYEGVAYDPKSRKYYGLAWVKDEQRYSWAEDYDISSPWVTGRYSKTSGEVRGRGPAMQCYPDVRSLNKAQEFALQKAAIDLAGMWTATNDGITNPYTIKIAPGIVIPVGSNASANPSLSRLDTSSDLQLAMFEVERMQTSIRKAFFNDLRDPTGPVRSATEIAIEARELAKRIGSAFGRLQTEVLIPILKRVFYILRKKGLVDVSLNGFETTVKFTSPLAAAQDQEDLLAVEQAIAFTMATGGEMAVQLAFKTEELGTYAGELTGTAQRLLRTDKEKQDMIQKGAEVESMQAEQGNVTPITSAQQ